MFPGIAFQNGYHTSKFIIFFYSKYTCRQWSFPATNNWPRLGHNIVKSTLGTLAVSQFFKWIALHNNHKLGYLLATILVLPLAPFICIGYRLTVYVILNETPPLIVSQDRKLSAATWKYNLLPQREYQFWECSWLPPVAQKRPINRLRKFDNTIR